MFIVSPFQDKSGIQINPLIKRWFTFTQNSLFCLKKSDFPSTVKRLMYAITSYTASVAGWWEKSNINFDPTSGYEIEYNNKVIKWQAFHFIPMHMQNFWRQLVRQNPCIYREKGERGDQSPTDIVYDNPGYWHVFTYGKYVCVVHVNAQGYV